MVHWNCSTNSKPNSDGILSTTKAVGYAYTWQSAWETGDEDVWRYFHPLHWIDPSSSIFYDLQWPQLLVCKFVCGPRAKLKMHFHKHKTVLPLVCGFLNSTCRHFFPNNYEQSILRYLHCTWQTDWQYLQDRRSWSTISYPLIRYLICGQSLSLAQLSKHYAPTI